MDTLKFPRRMDKDGGKGTVMELQTDQHCSWDSQWEVAKDKAWSVGQIQIPRSSLRLALLLEAMRGSL